MVYLTSQPYEKIYGNSLFSKASIVCYIVFGFAIFSACFICYMSNNFWTGIDFCYEQPIVNIRSDFLLWVTETDSVKVFSSLSQAKPFFTNTLAAPSFKVQRFDRNLDLKPDRYQITLHFPSEAANIQSINLILLLDYHLRVVFKETVDFAMQSFLSFQIESGQGISLARLDGQIVLKQNEPILGKAYTQAKYNTSLTDFLEENQFDFSKILLQSFKQNITTRAEYFSDITAGYEQTRTLIEINLEIPNAQKILYIPPFLDKLKSAWVQFIYLFVPIMFFLYKFLTFLYRNRIYFTKVQYSY